VGNAYCALALRFPTDTSLRSFLPRQRLLPPRNHCRIVDEVRPSPRLAGAFDVAILVAVALDRRLVLRRLPFLDIRQDITEPFVLGDGCMRHPLILVEHRVGQGITFPAHIKASVRICIGFDHLVAWVADFGENVRPVIFMGACGAA
jgi:hypothetical protein